MTTQTRAIRKYFTAHSSMVQGALPIVALVLVIALFAAVTHGRSLAPNNLKLLLGQVFTVLVVALGNQFVLAHGAFDLSMGGNAAVSMLVGALVLGATGNVVLCIAAMLAVAIGVELINGSIAAFLGLPGFLTSLVIMFILRAVMQYTSHVRAVSIDSSWGSYNNLTAKIVVLAICILLTFYLFNYTKLGKYNKLIGGNIKASNVLGVPVARYQLYAYLMTGLMVAVAAFFALMRERYIDQGTAMGLEFDVIVALIFGGMPMSGGARARFRAAIVGPLILAILFNGMIIWGLDTGVVALTRGILFVVIVFVGIKRTRGPLPK